MKRTPPTSHMPSFDRHSITLMMLGVAIMIALLSILTKPLPEPPPELHLGVQKWRTEQGAEVRFIPRRSAKGFVSLRWAAFNPNLITTLKNLCQRTQHSLDAYFRSNEDQATTNNCTATQTWESIELLIKLPSDTATLKAVANIWQVALSKLFLASESALQPSLPTKISYSEATSAMNTWVGIVAPLSRMEAQVLVEQLLKYQPAGSPQSITHITLTAPKTDMILETTSATNPSFIAAYALQMHLDSKTLAQSQSVKPLSVKLPSVKPPSVRLQPGILKSRLQLTSSVKPDTLLDRIQHPPSKKVLHQYWFDWYRMSAQQVDHPDRLAALLSSAGYLGWPREHLLYWHQLWSKLTVDQLETQWLKWYEVQTISSQTAQSQAAGANLKQSAHHRR